MLQVNQLTGFGGGGQEPFDVSYVTSGADGTNGTSHDFTAASFGALAGTRIIIAAISGRSGSTISAPTVTIGGIAATVIVQTAGDDDYAGLFWAVVPTDANLHIIVTWAVTVVRAGYAVYRMTGKPDGTAFATDQDATSVGNRTVNVAAGGAVIAHGYNEAVLAWTGITEQYEITVESNFIVGGLATGLAVETPRTISAVGWTGNSAVAVASFAP